MNSQPKNMTPFAKPQSYDLFSPEALLNRYPLYKRMRKDGVGTAELTIPFTALPAAMRYAHSIES
ncbi:hypothetical protein H6F71_17345 [Microcoleus sp. FACHB-61]|nr:hypothetical protein [Microcoleus sp. FACHB-61]